MSLDEDAHDPLALNYLGWIAVAVNMPQHALQYFDKAAGLAPDWKAPRLNFDRISRRLAEVQQALGNTWRVSGTAARDEKYLLIKAWGHGFWADVSHVLGQLLLAEITGRVPVVHWGSNCRFGDGTGSDAFEFYFERPAGVGIEALQRDDFSFWPPKWNQRNLTDADINKWSGAFSRMAGLYFLSRDEKVLVSDFFTSVLDLMPWIPAGHHLHGLPLDDLYRHLARRYLRPQRDILRAVDGFHEERIGTSDFIAVHVRGSDKVTELTNLDEINSGYGEAIDRLLSETGCERIFLMTDDSRLLERFSGLYPGKIVSTECQRTGSSTGVHYQASMDPRRLGREVMVDVYTALKARAFVGNGYSNPSLMVRYLKDWPENRVCMLGLNLHRAYHLLLHDWKWRASR